MSRGVLCWLGTYQRRVEPVRPRHRAGRRLDVQHRRFILILNSNSARRGKAARYFFGTNPVLVYDLDPAEVPANDLEEFVTFFSARCPGREETIKEFVETYASPPTDTEDKYQSPQEAGLELGVAWCTALGITPPEALI